MELDQDELERVVHDLNKKLAWVTTADVANFSYDLLSYNVNVMDKFVDYNRIVDGMTPNSSINGRGR